MLNYERKAIIFPNQDEILPWATVIGDIFDDHRLEIICVFDNLNCSIIRWIFYFLKYYFQKIIAYEQPHAQLDWIFCRMSKFQAEMTYADRYGYSRYPRGATKFT